MKFILLIFSPLVFSLQEFIEEPSSVEVNTKDAIILPCLIRNKAGECRWEKDGTPVGMFKDKYEWAGNVLSGDCGLVIHDASEEYDAGVWQCQVNATDFTQKDTLICKEIKIDIQGKIINAEYIVTINDQFQYRQKELL